MKLELLHHTKIKYINFLNKLLYLYKKQDCLFSFETYLIILGSFVKKNVI